MKLIIIDMNDGFDILDGVDIEEFGDVVEEEVEENERVIDVDKNYKDVSEILKDIIKGDWYIDVRDEINEIIDFYVDVKFDMVYEGFECIIIEILD